MTTRHPHPTLIDPEETLPLGPTGIGSWWFASRLEHEETVFWALIHAMTGPNGPVLSTVALLQDPADAEGHSSEKHVTDNLDDVTVSDDTFDVRTSVLVMSGDLDEIVISGDTDSASLQLTLRREDPVLFNAGSGMFPFFGGNTAQYALPGLRTSGTITADGVTYEISGRTWFDRQWGGGEGSGSMGFTWLGLDLGKGRYLSVWDTVGDGTSWLTELRSDGTHTITQAQRTGHDGHWTLNIPSLDGSLEITHRGLSSSAFAYTGACTATGKLAGQEITGHGYTDIIAG